METNFEENVRYYHFHDNKKKRHVTVGKIVDDSGQAHIAYSVCNPADRFSRAFGRNVVKRRLEKRNCFRVPEGTYVKSKHEIMRFLCDQSYAVEPCLESFAKKWLKFW